VLIATGSRPRVLPGAVPDGDRILNWRQLYDLTELPEHLVIVGSGVTGAEFCNAYTEFGVTVTVVASRDQILPIALAVQNRISVTDLAQTLSIYPSLTGSIVEAARRLMAHDDLD